MISIVRAKFLIGISLNGIAPPKQIEIILKNGMSLDFPMKKSRLLLNASFNAAITIEAIANKIQMHIQTDILNGKNNFSNDV